MANYYDTSALGEYLAKQKGAGLVPEFTNIKGASGFFIDSPREEEDERREKYIAPESFTDLDELEKETLRLEHELDNKYLTTIQEAKERAGIPQLESYLAMFDAAGLADSDSAKDYKRRIDIANEQVMLELGLDKRGQITGPSAEPFRKDQQYIDKLKLRAGQLARQEVEARRDTETKMTQLERIAVSAGVTPEMITVDEEIEDREDTAGDVARLNEDEKALLRKKSKNETIAADELLVSYPEASEKYKKLVTKTVEDAPAILAHIDDMEKAGKEAWDKVKAEQIAELRSPDSPYATASGEEKQRLLEERERKVKLDAIMDYKQEFIKKNFKLGNVDILTSPEFRTPKERELAQYALQVIKKVYRESPESMSFFERIQAKQNAALAYREFAPVDRDEQGFILEEQNYETIASKLLDAAIIDFNARFKNTLGISVNPETTESIAFLRLF